MGRVAEAPPGHFSLLLSPLQERIASIVRNLSEAGGFALAGAAGLAVQGLIDRPTEDLDFFTTPGGEAAIAALRDALEEALSREGLTVSWQRDLPTFVRLEVSDGRNRCQVDLAIDYRALPPVSSTHGPTLAPKELAAGKVLALFDRAEPRDFLDLAALVRHFGLDELIELATEKDPGFDSLRFIESLSLFRRLIPADLGLAEGEYERLARMVDDWVRHLRQGIDRKPPERGLDLGR